MQFDSCWFLPLSFELTIISRKVKMASEKTAQGLGLITTLFIASLVGLIGGGLFGVWDSISVAINHGSFSVAFHEIFFLGLYSIAIYAVLGCLVMSVIGILAGFVIRAGKYRINKAQLVSVYIGIFVLLALSVLLLHGETSGRIIDVVEMTGIFILSGIGLAALSMFVMGRRIRKKRLIALCTSLLVSLLVLLYSGLVVNMSLLKTRFFQPSGLLADIGILIFAGFLGSGLYILSLRILERRNPRTIRRIGYSVLALTICAFVTISIIGPFDFKNTAKVNTVNAAGSSALTEIEEKPNILWIVMDTVRADHLSCYGYNRNTTPNIDRIASEGILFENAISAGPWTLPSHASMFTGMFPSKHGTDAEHQFLEDCFSTIAEVLRSNGYTTFGYSNNSVVNRWRNLDQGFDTFIQRHVGAIKGGSNLADWLKVSVTRRELQNSFLEDDGARETNDVVKGWIAGSQQIEPPFFVFINYMEAHQTYHPPQDYATPYLPNGVNYANALKVSQNTQRYNMGLLELSDEDLESLLALYDGEISYLDFRLGQLFDYLRETGIMDDTLLIITADHGENFGEHGLRGHQLSIHDTLLHVPLVIRYPGSFDTGVRVAEQVQLTDLYPTVLDILDIDWDSEEIQGSSLLQGEEGRKMTFAIAEYALHSDVLKMGQPKFDVAKFARRLKTVRTGEFKYIWGSDGHDELYNVFRDPSELENLIETEPETALELKTLLKSG